jgi:hypothetical protein
MFINCPYCRALVATDLATDLPPLHCPQCKGPLRDGGASSASPSMAPTQRLADSSFGDSAAESMQDAGSRLEERFSQKPDVDSDPASEPEIERLAADIGITSIEAGTSASSDIETSDIDGDSAVSTMQGAPEDATMLDPDIASIAISSENTESAEIENVVVDTIDEASGGTAPTASPAPEPRPMRRRAGQTTPSFARVGKQQTPATRAWPAVAAIVALSGLLGVQMLLADRARLGADARWRPLLETMCGVLRCDLPPWREPAAFALVQRDVRQHPNVPGVLRVSASFRNDARWPQPWPALRLTLSDVNGRTAGERRFQASEYLGGAPTQSTLANGETATVAMDVVEPAAQIVAYDFRFD